MVTWARVVSHKSLPSLSHSAVYGTYKSESTVVRCCTHLPLLTGWNILGLVCVRLDLTDVCGASLGKILTWLLAMWCMEQRHLAAVWVDWSIPWWNKLHIVKRWSQGVKWRNTQINQFSKVCTLKGLLPTGGTPQMYTQAISNLCYALWLLRSNCIQVIITHYSSMRLTYAIPRLDIIWILFLFYQ